VVSVLGLEATEFGDRTQDVYVIGLPSGDKLHLPVHNLSQVGIRALVSAEQAQELIERVKRSPEPVARASARERAATYADGLRSGSPERYTAILQELLFRSRSATLSSGDRHALEVARGYFVDEIAAALDQSPDEITASLIRHESSPDQPAMFGRSRPRGAPPS
jgi:RNA polymerase-interacting CarD/CdnL/TRCF family regulator